MTANSAAHDLRADGTSAAADDAPPDAGHRDSSVPELPGAYHLYRAGFAIGRWAPRPLIDLAASAAGLFAAAALHDRREMVGRHIDRVTGHSLDPRARQQAVRRAFASYARYWVESARAVDANPQELEARTSYEGLDHIDAALAAGKGAILAIPHLGSWDLAGAWLVASAGFPLSVVVEPVRPPRLFEWFVERRKALGLEVVPLGPDAAGRVAMRLKANGVVALLCDRDLAGSGVEVELFGETTTLPAGPATLAFRTGAALLPVALYQRPAGRIQVLIRPPIDVQREGKLRADVTRITQALAHQLEQLIRAEPEQWHLFQPNWPSDPGYGL